MDRLTFYENDNCSFNIDQDFSMEESKGYWLKIHLDLEKAICKLGQYEDNDEKIGINYNIITQALLKGVYYIEFGTTQIRHTNGLSLQAFDGKRFCLANKNHHFVMEDYGKSKYNPWALTREELEKR